jgi:hypothetical protein
MPVEKKNTIKAKVKLSLSMPGSHIGGEEV